MRAIVMLGILLATDLPELKNSASPPSYPYTSQADRHLFRLVVHSDAHRLGRGPLRQPCVVIPFGKNSSARA
jgi:hypothetical protein